MLGLEETGGSNAEINEIYTSKLTITEKKYYDAWNKWHLFDKKLLPWEYLEEEKLWDHILMIQQFEDMRIQREEKKKDIEKEKKAKESYKSVFPPRPNNKTQSVL